MGDAAVRAAKAAGYENAGTIEFVLAPNKEFYFIEMNTRIQWNTRLRRWLPSMDLVREQIRIAAGLKLSRTQEEVELRGPRHRMSHQRRESGQGVCALPRQGQFPLFPRRSRRPRRYLYV